MWLGLEYVVGVIARLLDDGMFLRSALAVGKQCHEEDSEARREECDTPASHADVLYKSTGPRCYFTASDQSLLKLPAARTLAAPRTTIPRAVATPRS